MHLIARVLEKLEAASTPSSPTRECQWAATETVVKGAPKSSTFNVQRVGDVINIGAWTLRVEARFALAG